MARPKKILVDADALVAIAKEDDSNHTKSLKIAKKIKKDTLYITPFTIPEAVTVVSHRVSQRDAIHLLNQLRSQNLIEIALTPNLKILADKIFISRKTKGTSWVDCLNVASVKSENLKGIFSFDKFYQKLGIRTLN